MSRRRQSHTYKLRMSRYCYGYSLQQQQVLLLAKTVVTIAIATTSLLLTEAQPHQHNFNHHEKLQELLQQQSEPTDTEETNTTVLWIKRLLVTALLVAIAYLYLDRKGDNDDQDVDETNMTPEQRQEARRKRMKYLEQQQQQQQQQQVEIPTKTAELKRKAPATTNKIMENQATASEKSLENKSENNNINSDHMTSYLSSRAAEVAAATTTTDGDTNKDSTHQSTGHKSNISPSLISSSTDIENENSNKSTHGKGTTGKSQSEDDKNNKKQTAVSKAAATKPVPSITATTEPSKSKSNKESSKLANNNNNNKKANKNNGKAKCPRDIFLQSLATITGTTIHTQDGETTFSPPKSSLSPTNSNNNNKSAKATIQLMQDLAADMTWDQLTQLSSSFYTPFQTYLQTYQPPRRYGPPKLSDGPVWILSEWYHDAKTNYVKNVATSILKSCVNDQQQLQSCLCQFADAILYLLVTQLHDDIQAVQQEEAEQAKSHGVVEDDDDMDLGLFADESYGGGIATTATPAPVASDSKTNSTKWVQQILQNLEEATCTRILSKTFLATLVDSYNTKYTNGNLAEILLQQTLQRLPAPHDTSDVTHSERAIMALQNLLTLSPHAVQALARQINSTNTTKPSEGVQWELQSPLRSLLSLTAFSVPRFGKASHASSPRNRGGRRGGGAAPYEILCPPAFHAMMVQAMGPEYPVCLYARQGYETSLKSYHSTVKSSRQIMKVARTTSAVVLKKIAASSSPNNTNSSAASLLRKGGILFDWVGALLETNEPIVDMLQSDLLSPDSAQALCASRPFLLGVAASLLQMSSASLSKKLDDSGAEAFDYRYFMLEKEIDENDKSKLGVVIPTKERCLIDLHTTADGDGAVAKANKKKAPNDSTTTASSQPARFAGATEFFFLIAGLLRVSLFPGFRVDEEFQSMMRNIFVAIQDLASQQPSVQQLKAMGRDQMEQLQKCTSVTQGWIAFVDDPDMSPLITAFSLLQLQWVASTATTNTSTHALSRIPEWFVKLPAQWLAHVAVFTPQLLQPQQGEAAVKYATQILQVGTKSKQSFSPPVLCELIRIAGAFVREGVRRAKNREQNKAFRRGHNSRGFKNNNSNTPSQQEEKDFERDIIDDRTLDIYHSFDKRDLGVTVFTNQFVATELCPTLMRAYMAMDAVEGMDVEREHHFEKFQVKHEVADLLLRLWFHPNGESRNALVKNFDEVAMNEFVSSIAGALGFQLDQSCQFLLDIRDIRSTHEQQYPHRRQIPPLSRTDENAIEHHARFISFSLQQCRRLLMILCSFSKEQIIAATVGGKQQGKGLVGKSAASDLAAMFVNLIDRLTDEDGGIHPELEIKQLATGKRSSELRSRLGKIGQDELNESLHYFLHSRRVLLLEYGMDISMLTHQLLALAARWHIAAATVGKDGARRSKFLDAVANNDLCNINQLRCVFNRLTGSSKEMSGTELDNAAYILERDGHVDLSIWKDSYKVTKSGPNKGRDRMKTAKQDTMTREDLDSLVELQDVEAFLSDLELAIASKTTTVVAAKWGTGGMESLEAKFFGEGPCLKEDEYSDNLSDWVVSSDSFLAKAGNGSFAHSYDSIVRGRSAGAIGSSKVLVKEARKCQKLIPVPHPNTSVFVCFAEERSDLCKAIIIGAADTPFALGMFEFDILFPSNYPASPPLLNFKTTGDGRTRISSNLYNDGKVCISILGTYQAWDDSQRWNPSTSSLAQVLASIQTQLLGDSEPFFSDGFNHDSVRGTPAGERGSKRFNNKIRLHTLRHGMIDHLKKPALGFDEVTKRHFSLCRKRVLAQARLWTMEAQGTPLFRSFVKAYEELLTLLSSDDIVRHQLPGESGQKADAWGAVPADPENIKALASVDPTFVQKHGHILKPGASSDEDDSKPAAVSVSDSVDTMEVHQQEYDIEVDSSTVAALASAAAAVTYNPWASSSSLSGAPLARAFDLLNTDSSERGGEGNGDAAMEDDFDDMYA